MSAPNFAFAAMRVYGHQRDDHSQRMAQLHEALVGCGFTASHLYNVGLEI